MSDAHGGGHGGGGGGGHGGGGGGGIAALMGDPGKFFGTLFGGSLAAFLLWFAVCSTDTDVYQVKIGETVEVRLDADQWSGLAVVDTRVRGRATLRCVPVSGNFEVRLPKGAKVNPTATPAQYPGPRILGENEVVSSLATTTFDVQTRVVNIHAVDGPCVLHLRAEALPQ